MKSAIKVLLMFIPAALLMQSCLKPDEYPPVPAVSYKSIAIISDSLILEVDFTDGDGDIGLNPGDTTGEFAIGKPYYYNLFVQYWEWNHNTQQWQPGLTIQGDTISFDYRIPYITPGGRNKALKGVIQTTIEPIYYNPISPYSDTIKYKIRLVDRAFNSSNKIWTPEIWNGVVQN
jgi:hypothetical protein